MSGIVATKANYVKQLKDLLPEGPAWTREDGSVLVSVLEGLAEELTRVHQTANVLCQEANPLLMSVTLDSREAEAGLPDACTLLADSTIERKGAVVSRWARRGGQSRAFFTDLAESIGYDISIEDQFNPFTAVSSATDFLNSASDWRFTWRVTATDATVTSVFRAGESACTDPLQSFGNQRLECVIERSKPARSIVIFAYV